MKRFATAGAAGLMVATASALILVTSVSGASAQTTTTTAAGVTTTTFVSTPPIQGAQEHHIVIYVDTVTGGGTPKPAGTCLEENQFVQGQLVVFRMWADDTSAGGLALTDRNTEAAYVTIPGKGKVPMAYSAHEKNPAYWEVPWSTKGYPIGTVNFTVTVIAKPLARWGVAAFKNSTVPAQAGVFSQKGFASESDLTVVAP